ncbi:MAG: hypothetical protein HUU38_26355 [Anaerolineales bacterium]|nr:hypothetical protein [Anaerolineales bacterium]
MFTQEEIDEVVKKVSQVLPAGNVPELILSGLLRLGERRLQKETVRTDLAQLMRGVENTLDKAAYLGYFGGPAAAIWVYQYLLTRAGKKVEDAFPEGVWQFYVCYGLREDTARHTNETHGFDTTLTEHQIHLDEVERMAAWVMAAAVCLHQYDEFLATEWKERTGTCLLRKLTQGQRWEGYFADLYRQWAEQKPYSREEDAGDDEQYPVYRWNKFKRFVLRSVRALPPGLVDKWRQEMTRLEREQLPRYQRQMTIMTTLVPGTYEEIRQPIPLEDAKVGLVYHGHYYLIPICEPGTRDPVTIDTILDTLAAIVRQSPTVDQTPAMPLTELAHLKRAAYAELWPKLSEPFQTALQPLATVPILLNFDPRDRTLPLAEIRQAERGLGTHPLTVFTTGPAREGTGGSFIFDQSHIFFDGAWGAAFAEIFTNEAISWARYLQAFPPESYQPAAPRRMVLTASEKDLALIQAGAKCTPEATAETNVINIQGMVQLRKLFKMRSDLLHLTVNDMLVLYRAIHALTYQPSVDLIHKLRELAAHPDTCDAAQAALSVMTEKTRINPTVLIPVDASVCDPRERVHPLSFEVPLTQLDLLSLHERTIEALNEYDKGVRTAYAQFDTLQRQYLLTLASLGEVFHQVKSVAISGQTASVKSLKLLANVPMPLQKWLNAYSDRIGWMNDMLKGREVFSNIGRVVYTSTLSRFLTAKDDNDQKDLAWGVLTDKEDQMYLTLRDFRPHVAALFAVGQKDLANAITQDYLNGYANGLNLFLRDLGRITVASRETKLSSRANRNLLQRRNS